ncbi:hypothetical protein FE391_33630 [Nonomuraea sp. KC401]|uniref:hypothetical protein n=1 Tax=unclassified Nonomuraea TaxID=2593643 RepID=UPI0010FD01EE|nr:MULTISPECIES: hypothetical protein [unclassified Nonomuraea]NBE98112.1 hypothetical protein [Nonomuraea sp. K271]TLF60418.1 hypothetical protein FE391_33630 [Nonomuraea sp. KC401]
MTTDSGEWETRHQDNLIDLADDLAELDTALLAQLDPVDRARQERARRALWLYADAMWDAVKATKPGEGTPGARNPYNCVAALRDFTQALHSSAEEAQQVAGDPDPGDDDAGDVAMWAERFTKRGSDVPTYTLPDLAPDV